MTVTWWTHKIRDLRRNDFIMAAKTNRLYEDVSEQGEIELPPKRR